MSEPLISFLIPARNEPYLKRTIEDILEKCRQPLEILVALEGYWPENWAQFVSKCQNKVITIHNSVPIGMRGAINACVSASRGKYLLKCDAHVRFEPGFEDALIGGCGSRVVCVPRRYRLDAERWQVINDGRPPIDYEYLSFPDLGGREWKERAVERANITTDDCPTFQGSAWLMRRSYFDFLELMDADTFGTFFHEAQEICLKAWLSGGHVRVVKLAHYAHLHKSKEMGRGYKLEPGLREQAVAGLRPWLTQEKAWAKQIRPLSSLIAQFSMPSWPNDWQKQIASV